MHYRIISYSAVKVFQEALHSTLTVQAGVCLTDLITRLLHNPDQKQKATFRDLASCPYRGLAGGSILLSYK